MSELKNVTEVTIGGHVYGVADIPVKAARNALAVQSACNLSGVILSMAEDCKEISRLGFEKGTDWKNSHPVFILYAVQIAHLTHSGTALMSTPDRYSKASDICKEAAK